MRKITEQEINQIFDFTKKHYVEFYDVQVELVDHLANAIEDQFFLDSKSHSYSSNVLCILSILF